MKKSFTALCLTAIALVTFWACDDSTSTIGSSLSGQSVEIIIDSSYTVSGQTVRVEQIRPKSTQLLLGRINIPAYGTLETSNVMQFLPSTALDTANYTAENVDSLLLTLRYMRGAFMGDSVAPLGLTVHKLMDGKLLPNDITSSFDPEGWYDSTPLASVIYNASTFNGTDSEKAATYRDITIKLSDSRTDNLGRSLYQAFIDHPEYYANGRVFAENVFPGIYAKTSYGSGRMTVVSVTSMNMYLRKIYIPTDSVTPDTLDAVHTYYLVTPEVVANNNISYTMSADLEQRMADGGKLLVAPAGCEVELTFPLEKILASYKSNSNAIVVPNSLSLDIPADTIENGAGISAPPYLLMVLKKDRDEFFAKNKLTDNVTSFYASYNSTTGSYSFSSMRDYLTEMAKKESITGKDYTFSLVPVQVTFEDLVNTSYYGTAAETEVDIQPYLTAPVMAELRLDDAKIKFAYSLQTQK